MLALDFEYDGRYLSDFGFIVCDFNNTSGANTVEVGSQIDFKMVSTNHGKSNTLTSSDFNGTIQATFDICKDPDKYDQKDMYISSDEYRDIARWLNRGQFCLFQALYKDEDYNREPCFYKASFNLSKILIGEKLAGITVEMTTDKPFGYAERITKIIDTDSCERTYDTANANYTAANVLFDTTETISNSVYNLSTSSVSINAGQILIFYVQYQTAATRTITALKIYKDKNTETEYTGNQTVSKLGTEYTIIIPYDDGTFYNTSVSFVYPKDGVNIARITRLSPGTPSIIYGYGSPANAGRLPATNNEKIYINKNTGAAFVSNNYSWIEFATCAADSYTDNVYDPSDDVGYIYPDVVLTCGQAGNYTIRNALEGTTTYIANCIAGEVITMYGQSKIIETTAASHDIATDFNFQFLKIGNTYEDNKNTIILNAPGTLAITFDPIIKDCI